MLPDIQPLFDQLQARVDKSLLLQRLDIMSRVRPSVRLATQQVPLGQIPMGGSRIGGAPDVPPNFEWPRWAHSKARKDRFGARWKPESPTPLAFIAQLDLSELPMVDESLPTSGWLYFFYDRYYEPWGFDPNDRGGCRVIYATCDRDWLIRAEPPADLDQQFQAAPSIIDAWPELALSEEDWGVYDTPEYDACFELRSSLILDPKSPCHRLLGHPQLIQNPMERECQLASNGIYCGGPMHADEGPVKALEAGVKDWQLLLQIDTDDDGPGWMWGDCGMIYFWIKKQDLAALRFEDVWLVLQCT